MSETGLDGAKDVFFSHDDIVRKENPSHQNRYMLDHPHMFTQLTYTTKGYKHDSCWE